MHIKTQVGPSYTLRKFPKYRNSEEKNPKSYAHLPSHSFFYQIAQNTKRKKWQSERLTDRQALATNSDTVIISPITASDENSQIDRQIDRQMERQMDRQAPGHELRHRDHQPNNSKRRKQPDRQTDRQTDGQTDRQTDSQTDR